MTFTPVGSLVQTSATSLSLDPANTGDLILVSVVCSSANPPTGISGGGCTWVQYGSTFTGTIQPGLSAAVYAGTVTATGPATATLAFSGGTPATIRCAGQEFSSTAGFALDASGTLDSNGRSNMPSLTPAASGELYYIFEYDSSSASAGSTPGYTYQTDSHSNGMCYDPACGSGAQAPTWASTTCQFGIAVLVKPSGSPPPATALPGLLLAGII